MTIHHLDLIVEDGVPRIKFRCTGTPDADCRRRPPNWEERGEESWSTDEATETGFDCWAADWIDAVGMEDAVLGQDGTYASSPILISYEEGVSISPALAQESLAVFEQAYVKDLSTSPEPVKNGVDSLHVEQAHTPTELRQVIWEAVSDACEGRTGGEPHATTWARGGHRNDVPMLCDRCARLIETLTSRLSAAEVRSTDTTKDPRERAEYLTASRADAAMADWRPATNREDGSKSDG